jgi:hypothetical protein
MGGANAALPPQQRDHGRRQFFGKCGRCTWRPKVQISYYLIGSTSLLPEHFVFK